MYHVQHNNELSLNLTAIHINDKVFYYLLGLPDSFVNKINLVINIFIYSDLKNSYFFVFRYSHTLLKKL